MLFSAVVLCQVERLMCLPISFAVLGFLFMACTMEVVLLKLTTTDPVLAPPAEDWEENGGPDGDILIYYENLENNYEYWARTRMRFYRQQPQQQQQQQQHLPL
ncbi:GD10495 [Drosophila simulans]|uniref:GD10495 n=1 Tax=Drosophila simulans TaxID=7240 RepID=B4QEP9_DROSI|nr:GD10495 [Drosophila simulans]